MTSSCNQNRPQVPRFSLGTVVATPGALETLSRYRMDSAVLLWRHLTGDWGDLCAEDAMANDEALLSGARILSSYALQSPPDQDLGTAKVWVITEADRSVTTLLLPEEY